MPGEAGSLGMSQLPDTWLQGLLCGQLNCIHLDGKGPFLGASCPP